MKFHDGWYNKMGYPSSRRSWHGQSSTRASYRYYPTKNTVVASNGLGRYINPLCVRSHQRYASHSKSEARCEKPVHATLVSVNYHKNRGRTHRSTGSLRMPPKEEPCRLSNRVTTKRSRSCGHSTSNIEFSPHFEKTFQGYQRRNSGRDQSVSGQSSDVNKLRSGRPRSPPGYITAMANSQGRYCIIYSGMSWLRCTNIPQVSPNYTGQLPKIRIMPKRFQIMHNHTHRVCLLKKN